MNYEKILSNEINNEDSGLWFVSSSNGNKIILKLPTNTIKSIYKGCTVELFIKIYEYEQTSYLIVGTRIHDSSTHPLIAYGIDRFEGHNGAIKTILNQEKIRIEI
ncbi:hypothetical protein [uncultured Flavobacterium sp.]|uniref:hypothetical protein n=1 Tax=uncultured Flavobacterium sp. TaxID=165435 RepID=UPI0025D4D122|nr:hypothetical protein [uncultured Flavobacterium sp.]